MEEDLTGAGYNVNQSKIAIGSGGLTGKGFLNGTQTKLKYVPEQDTDFIFCTVGEEQGFVGSAGFSYFDIEIDIPFRKATVCFRSRIWVFGREYFPLSPIYQYRDGVRADSCNWYPITLL